MKKTFPIGNLDILEQSLHDYDEDLFADLLIDRTTGSNIRWATSDYRGNGSSFEPEAFILPELVTGPFSSLIQPRAAKTKAEQERRTKDNAEVFTPSWICNKQNNLIDKAWFGHTRTFNRECGTKWTAVKKPVEFPDKAGRRWQDYIKENRLEIACGEAPYLVSRYDATTGEFIPVHRRIGLLDRKLRIACENTATRKTWHKRAAEAFKSIYGFDYQGDNVLLARENLLYTYADYHRLKFGDDPTLPCLKEIADIISWNIWQMDGLDMTAPYSRKERKYVQSDISSFLEDIQIRPKEESTEPLKATIMDWDSNSVIEFSSIAKG